MFHAQFSCFTNTVPYIFVFTNLGYFHTATHVGTKISCSPFSSFKRKKEENYPSPIFIVQKRGRGQSFNNTRNLHFFPLFPLETLARILENGIERKYYSREIRLNNNIFHLDKNRIWKYFRFNRVIEGKYFRSSSWSIVTSLQICNYFY